MSVNKEKLVEIKKYYRTICDYYDAVPGQVPSRDQRYFGILFRYIEELESKNTELESALIVCNELMSKLTVG